METRYEYLRMLGMGLIAAVLFLSLLSLKGVGQEPPRKNPPPQGRSEGKNLLRPEASHGDDG
jgi:Na+-transporting methylmalonyl-CoA/oxaloacetate decarboxylase, gamma subunit